MQKSYNSLGDALLDLIDIDLKNSKLIGDTLYIPLDEERRILISLKSPNKNRYNTLLFEVYSKTRGKLHTEEYTFQNMTHTIMLQKERVTFNINIQKDSKTGKYRWVGYDPTEEQTLEINKTIENFIELWK